MQMQTMSPNQLRKAGLAALAKSLGPAGMARFIQQYDVGMGDYTKDRSNWLNDMSLDEIIQDINRVRNNKKEK
ncbi:MAG: hypothetical protein ACOX0T_00740 [Pelotomaculum sp.]|jgi:hypothetical protein